MARKITESFIPCATRPRFTVDGAHPWDHHSTREDAEKQAAELDAKDAAEAERQR